MTMRVSSDYSTLQAAHNACSAGDSLYIVAGTYDESIDVGTSINILLDPLAHIDPVTTPDWCIDIAADGVLVRGGKMTARAAKSCIQVQGGVARTRIERVYMELVATSWGGVRADTSSTDLWVRHCYIDATGNLQQAVRIQNGVRCWVTDNYLESAVLGVYMNACTHAHLLRNVIGNGVEIRGNTRPVMFANLISSSNNHGLRFRDCSDGVQLGNSAIITGSKSAIYLDTSAGGEQNIYHRVIGNYANASGASTASGITFFTGNNAMDQSIVALNVGRSGTSAGDYGIEGDAGTDCISSHNVAVLSGSGANYSVSTAGSAQSLSNITV